MTQQVTDQKPTETPADTDMVAEVHRVLQASAEPLTLSKIRAQLPGRFRSIEPEKLAEVLQRQVVAGVLWQYPKYRSQQDRFWDRPMPVHVTALISGALEQGALAWSELRRKLPAYAQDQAETVLAEQVAQGRLHRYPRAGRGGDRYGVQPPDPKDYLRSELVQVFQRLEQLGFTQNQLREGALELLHEEEWSTLPSEEASAASEADQRRSDEPAEHESAEEASGRSRQESAPPHAAASPKLHEMPPDAF